MLILAAANVRAQDYIRYQRIFNRVDEDILNHRLSDARQRLDSVAHQYDFIYAVHCVKALQVALVLADSAAADKWLVRSLLRGVPLWMLRQNEITRQAYRYANCRATLAAYDSLHQVYRAAINQALARQIDSLLAIDFRYTGRVNNGFFLLRHTLYGLQWLHNNKKEFRILSKIIDAYGYPGERIIGLPLSYEDSAAYAPFVSQAGLSVALQDRRVLFILLHYYSTPRHDINDKLYANLLTGNIPASHYARINDYLAEYDKHRHGQYVAYGVHGRAGNTADPDTRRAAIGLNTLAAQHRNDSLVLEYRKKKAIHREIILE